MRDLDELYKDMTALLEDDRQGRFGIDHFTIDPNTLSGARAMIRQGIPAGEYVRLTDGFAVVMSNTPMEKRTNRQFVETAHGRVLIGGLGIGMIILAIQDKEDIDEIIVIEKNQEVIDLIQPQLKFNSKVKIVKGDVFTYEPEGKFNTIYMDIWYTIGSDIYEEEMKPLIKRYRKYLVSKSEDPNCWIDCWAKNNAKYDRELI